MDSLGDKLKALGVRLGIDGLPNAEGIASQSRSIEKLLPQGKTVASNIGEFFLIEENFPANQLHGRYPVYSETNYQEFLRLLGLNPDFDLERCVFMDTETTGLAGGTGTLAFMVGLGFYNNGDFDLFQGFLRDPSDERAMLEVMSERLTGIDTVVTYNGKSFDVPLLHSRCVINGITKAFAGMRHIDLLHVARKLWKHRLSSRTLGVVENEILGFFRSAEEVPGWMAPELYFQYQKTGDASGIVPVFYHNAMDIVTLGVLLRVVAELINQPDSFDSPGVDIVSIARMYTDLKDFDHAISLYEKGIQRELPVQIYLDALLRFADLFKRQHLFEKSVPLWEKAVSFGSEEACEELAKYYEHQVNDYESAIKWVNAGFDCLKRQELDLYHRRRQEEAFQQRLERLLGKWQKSNSID